MRRRLNKNIKFSVSTSSLRLENITYINQRHIQRRKKDLKDENERIGLVMWIDDNHPFSMPGDSESLVYI